MVDYKCKICCKEYTRKFNYDRHKNKKFPCKPENLNESDKIHIESYIKVNEPTDIITQDSYENPMQEKVTNQCKYCNNIFSTNSNFNRHMRLNCKVKQEKDKDGENMMPMILQELKELKDKNKTLEDNFNNKINKQLITKPKVIAVKTNSIKTNNVNTDNNIVIHNNIKNVTIVNVNNKLIHLLKDRDVRVLKETVKLDDLLDKIIKSANKEQYIKRAIREDFTEYNGFKYITIEKCKELLEKTNRKEAKYILTELNRKEVTVSDKKSKIVFDLVNNCFSYNGIPVTIIVINGVIWFKGKDVAGILGYEDPRKAIYDHVDNNDKKTFKELSELFGKSVLDSLKSQDEKTIFVNESGLYSLIFGSKKELAKEFKNLVTSEILPSIRKYGTYSTQPTEAISFYDNNLICNFDNKNVLYLGSIGEYNNEMLIKFGKSGKVFQRDYDDHKKFYGTFNVLHIVECDNKDIVEQLFKKEMQARNTIRNVMICNKMQYEVFALNSVFTDKKAIEVMNDLVKQYPLQAIKDKELEIKELYLKHEYDKEIMLAKEQTKQKELDIELEKSKILRIKLELELAKTKL